MDENLLHSKAPRPFEVLTGIVLAVISPLFILMSLYLPIAIYKNDSFSAAIIIALMILWTMGIGLPVLSYRLITGKGAKNSTSLFLAHTLNFWALFFGVASLMIFALGVFISDFKMILMGPFGLVMAYSIVKLVNRRKYRSDGS